VLNFDYLKRYSDKNEFYMKYFTVVGNSVEEVTAKIFKEYGGKAYIITFNKELKQEERSRKWYAKPFLKPEIVQMVSYKAYCGLPENDTEINEIKQKQQEDKVLKTESQKEDKVKQEQREQEVLEEQNNKEKSSSLTQVTNKEVLFLESSNLSGGLEVQNNLLRKEIEDLRQMMSYLVYKESNLLEDEQIHYLLQLDFSYEFAKTLVQNLKVPINNIDTLKIVLKEKLKLNINIKDGLKYHHGEVYLFIGPTGVGKTTTLAKIAALFYKEGLRDFTFFSFDSYKLGADEQLKKYAKVFEKEFFLIQNQNELQKILNQTDNGSVIFIDTAGEGLEKEIKLSEIQDYLKFFNKRINTILVLNANSKMKDLELVKRKFSRFDINAYIITKLDETKTFGPILEFIYTYSKEIPVVYYTDGQEVPDNINKITLDTFFKYF
jgi:flagellar biosynthesis protein FlhF